MASIDSILIENFTKRDGPDGVSVDALRLATEDLDAVLFDVGELLCTVIDAARAEQGGHVVALARGALALLGKAGSSIDTLAKLGRADR